MMSSVLEAVKPRSRGQSKSRSPQGAALSLWSCLVVSSDEWRRRDFVASSENAEWLAFQAATADEAWQLSNRHRFRLVIIDAAPSGLPERQALRELVEKLSGVDSPLVAYCSGRDDLDDEGESEIWAREQGLWLYLPDVVAPDMLASVWDEARRVAAKLAGEIETFSSPTRRLMTP